MNTPVDQVRFATGDEAARWDEFIIAQEAERGSEALQVRAFAELKGTRGWTPRYLVTPFGYHVALERSFPLIGKFWFFPKGPIVRTMDQLREVVDALRPFAKQHGVIAMKVEPSIPIHAGPDPREGSPAFRAAELAEQNQDTSFLEPEGYVSVSSPQVDQSTIIAELAESMETTRTWFRPKHRNAINRAKREGGYVEAVDTSEENCRKFYTLLDQSSQGRFKVRSLDYYRAFWQGHAESGRGQLFFGYDPEGNLVAGAFVILLGKHAVYKDGASVTQKVVFGASHLLQDEIMTWLTEQGYTSYDLMGTPPASELDNKEHRFYGLGVFKTGFEKSVIERLGAHDVVLSPWRYKLWMLFGERALAMLNKRKFGESLY